MSGVADANWRFHHYVNTLSTGSHTFTVPLVRHRPTLYPFVAEGVHGCCIVAAVVLSALAALPTRA